MQLDKKNHTKFSYRSSRILAQIEDKNIAYFYPGYKITYLSIIIIPSNSTK